VYHYRPMAQLPLLVEHGAIAWKLVIAAAAAVAIALAWRRRVRRVQLGGARTLWIGLVVAGLAAGALYGAGRLARSLATMDLRGPLVPAQLGELDLVSLAAATPGNRDAALGELEARFSRRYQRTESSLAQWQEVARLRGGCAAELRLRTAEDQIEGLAALARGCDDGEAAADALRALGFLDDAHALHPPISPWQSEDLEPLIAAGRWPEAAEQIARSNASLRAVARRPQTAITCLEQWVRGRAGAPLPARTEQEARDPLCAAIDALALSREAQALALSAIAAATAREEVPDSRVDPLATRAALGRQGTVPMLRALAWAAGAPLDPADGDGTATAEAMSIPMGARIAVDAAGLDINEAVAVALLAPIARTVRDDAPATRGFVLTHFWSAVNAMLRGDRATARAEARAAQRRDGSGDSRADRWQHEAGSLETALALRAGEPLPEDAEHHVGADPDAIAIRLGEPLGATRFPLRSEVRVSGPDLLEALRAAVAGDATQLDDALATRGLAVTTGTAQLFALWPRVARDRERLAGHIRMIAHGDTRGRGLLERIAYAALRRDLALLIGDQAVAGEWQGIVERDLAPLADRDRLVGLILLKLAWQEIL